jgi:hypothetical protein
MNLEMIESKTDLVVISDILKKVKLKLKAIFIGHAGNKNFERYVFWWPGGFHILAEPNISKASLAEFVDDTIATSGAKSVMQMYRMMA